MSKYVGLISKTTMVGLDGEVIYNVTVLEDGWLVLEYNLGKKYMFEAYVPSYPTIKFISPIDDPRWEGYK